MEHLSDAFADDMVVFEAVELQVPTFFTSHSFIRTGGFPEENLPICFRCLRWNLTVQFSRCNRDSWTGCGHCSYVQYAQCKDVCYLSSFGPFRIHFVLLTEF
jgi:hypothetical protein